MEYKFIFPNHEIHKKARILTSTRPLVLEWGWYLKYDFTSLERDLLSFLTDDYMFCPSKVKIDLDKIISLNGGVNLANRSMGHRFFYPLRQVGYRLPGTKSGPSHDYNQPTAFEVLSYGVGIMRPVNPPITMYYKFEGGDGLPVISSNHVQSNYGMVYQSYNRGNGVKEEHQWRMQMTNLIFADTYGELEQLHNLNNKVLKVYLKNMREMCHKSNLDHHFGCTLPIWLQHIKMGVWSNPPETIKELLQRADYILNNTLVDNNPTTILKPLEYGVGIW